jgi:AcrR family transcriptional regulator
MEDPRPAITRQHVLQAARMILAADGQAAVTPTRLEEVSGVARSTIYRHWPNASAVLAEAMQLETDESELRSTGDAEADARAYLEQLRAMLQSPAAAIVIAQAEIAERDPKAATTIVGTGQHRSQVIRDLLNDPRHDFETVHAQLVGPLFMQRFFTRRPITDDLIDAAVQTYLNGRP